MEQAIKDFHKQFAWKAVVLGGSTSKTPKEVEPRRFKKFVLNGMGGSHLAADLLRVYDPKLDLTVVSDYGLPELPAARLKGALLIASSFSGNTEEAIDFAEQALKQKLPLAVIAKGGKLLEFAKAHQLPHVALPQTTIQPRSGLGFQMIALAALIGNKKLLQELGACTESLRPEELAGKGEALAGHLRSKLPVIYSSARNSAVAYNWKIKFNETGKIPAFYNVFPELNHNEMTGFDIIGTTEGLSRKFHFLFLTDSTDHPQNRKRMQVTRKLYEDRGIPVTEVALEGSSTLERIFTSLLTADWTAVHLSKIYGTEAEQVPMVEEFKRLVS